MNDTTRDAICPMCRYPTGSYGIYVPGRPCDGCRWNEKTGVREPEPSISVPDLLNVLFGKKTR